MLTRATLAFLLLLATAAGSAATPGVHHSSAEIRVVKALQQIRAGQTARAAETLRTLLETHPGFDLARFLYGQIWTSRAGKPVATGERPGAEALLAQARRRWRHYQSPVPPGAIPNAILRLAPRYRYAIVVDLPHNRLYLFRNDHGRPRLVADFYASIGSAGAGKRTEGDERTPVGVYHIHGYKPDRQLPALYGAGALPLNYPNAWDRKLGRTGYGIWLHGVPETTFSRPPRASAGCVVVPNQALKALRERVRGHDTPVILTNDLHWLTPGEARSRRHRMIAALVRLRPRGQSTRAGIIQRTSLFRGGGQRPLATTVLEGALPTRLAEIGLRGLSIYDYPGEANLMMTTLPTAGGGRRTLFWRRLPGPGWQVVYRSPSSLVARVRTGDEELRDR